MLDSIRQQILLKLNLQEPPENLPAATSIPPSMLSTYYAHLQSVDADDSHECSRSEGSEATHFSRNLELYYPHNFVSVKLPPDHFQIGKAIILLFIIIIMTIIEEKIAKNYCCSLNLMQYFFLICAGNGDDGKGEEVKEPEKGTTDTDSDVVKSPSIAPVFYKLEFDNLNLSDINRLWSVQLQLYKRKAPSEALSLSRGSNPVENVKVYRVLRNYAYGESRKNYILLASKNIPSEDEGLVAFNITGGVKDWLQEAQPETSLELTVHVDTPELVDTGLSLPPAIVFDVPSGPGPKGEHNGPKSEHNAHLLVERLNKREVIESNHLRSKRQLIEGVSREHCINEETNCCIKDLTVNFQRDLGWDWILYPHSFKPNYCKGECNSLNSPRATKSTEFLMLLRASNPTAAAEPCCVPQKTRSLTVLMRINEVTSLHSFPNMIVDSCICR